MGTKKSCQNVKVPRPLNAVEQRLYGWVEEAVFTQPSVVLADDLPEHETDRGCEWGWSPLIMGVPRVIYALGGSFAVYGFPTGSDDALLRGGEPASSEWGRKLFGSFKESIQEFKWHYFKVLSSPGRRAFWLNHEDSLLLVKMKQSKLDCMMSMLDDPGRMAPRSVKKGGFKRERTPVVDIEKEEGAKEDPSADLKPKRHKKGGKGVDLTDRVLGEDAAWEHPVNPLELAFPKEFNFRKALDVGLTTSSVRKPLQTMLSDQLLGES
ncbi:hypothetical protein PIB30_017455 [Stylosanthes scabra]|uniref:Uncharacterized protein n=1 Tax=Stylosanthes scabra TaxID=79078 RepID=A0ABU6Y8A6_9FABA|nr:hypothetical protein [Stylosanthes scabra]